MYTINEQEVEWLDLPGRRCRVMVGGVSLEADYITFGVTEVPPRTKMSPHKHDKEEEIIFILNGFGEVTIDGEAEKLEPGTAIYLPVGSEHFIDNKSDDTMKFTFAFSPAVRIGSYG